MKFRKSRDVTDELTESEKLMLDKACSCDSSRLSAGMKSFVAFILN